MLSSDELDVARHEDYVEIRFKGTFNPAAARGVVDTLAKASGDTGLPRVLLDCRGMRGPLTIVDRFEVAEYGADALARHIVVALVGREGDILPDNFFENVAQSRGVRVKVFTDAREAVTWLRGQ